MPIANWQLQIGHLDPDCYLGGFDASKVFLFTPGFSPVERHYTLPENRFKGFHGKCPETVETVSIVVGPLAPG